MSMQQVVRVTIGACLLVGMSGLFLTWPHTGWGARRLSAEGKDETFLDEAEDSKANRTGGADATNENASQQKTQDGQVSATDLENDAKTPDPDKEDGTYMSPPWTAGAIATALLVSLCGLSCVCLACGGLAFNCYYRKVETYSTGPLFGDLEADFLPEMQWNYLPEKTGPGYPFHNDGPHARTINRYVRGQAVVNRLVMVLGAASVFLANATSVPPVALTAVVVLPHVARSRVVEYRCLQLEFENNNLPLRRHAVNMAMACLENYDDYSDGVVIASMYLADAVVHQHFVASFMQSSWGVVRSMAPLMDFLHMWGLGLFFLVMGQTLQWAVTLSDWHESAPVADSVGFSALASSSLSHDAHEARGFLLGVSRVMWENIPSGQLASSYLMFAGVQDLREKPIALVSALLSSFALLKKSMELIMLGLSDITRPVLKMTCLVVGTITLGMAAWILAKLHFIQACPDHAWQITSGCFTL